MDQQIQASGFVIQPRFRFKHLRDQMLFQFFMTEASYRQTSQLDVGQLFIQISEINRQLGWSRKEITVSLKRLEDEGLISKQTLPSNKGLLISVTSYINSQSLKNYKKEGYQTEDEGHQPEEKGQQKEEQGHQGVDENVDTPTDEGLENKGNGQQSENKVHQPEEKGQRKEDEGQLNNITAFFNSMLNSNININQTLKQHVDQAGVKKMNLTSTEDVETFVDFALLTNAFPEKVSKKVLVTYFDCIRLNRQTCHISAKLLANFAEKLTKYSANQINYALWKHVVDHDDKPEKYTLGILRNVTEPDACRGLMKLKNMKGAGTNDAIAKEYAQAAGAEQSSTRAEAQRLQELARSKGLGRTIRDSELDF